MRHAAFALLWCVTPALATPAKPALQRHTHEDERLAYDVKVRPGAPDAGDTVAIEIELAELLERPHPKYGRRRPLNNANLRVALVCDPATAKRGKKGEPWVAHHHAIRLADAGLYAVTFTAPQAGWCNGFLRGEVALGGESTPIHYAFPLAYGVWPAPAHDPPELPLELPPARGGDIESGRKLCAELCRQDIPGAKSTNGVLTFLPAAFAEPLSDEALSRQVTDGKATRRSPVEQANLIHFLRHTHAHTVDFFPEATAALSSQFELDEYALKRLAQHGITPRGAEIRGTVFVLYQSPEAQPPPRRVSYEDTIARDALERDDRVGYLVFLPYQHDGVEEIGIAMAQEPSYTITKIAALGPNATANAKLTAALSKLEKQGAFNDPASLTGGDAALRAWVVPMYLRAAELATAYYGAEREFTAFDNAFQ